MKKLSKLFLLLVSLFLISFSNIVHAQELRENEVPKIIRNSFSAIYPDVYVYEWKWKKKKRIYEAEFIIKGIEYEAYFTPDGDWIRTERDVKRWEIPEAVWNSLAETEYANWKVDDREEHQTPEYPLVYEIEVELGRQEILLYFLPNGELVKTVIKR